MCSTIMLLAVVGTVISAMAIGGLTYGAAKAGMIDIDSSSPLERCAVAASAAACARLTRLAASCSARCCRRWIRCVPAITASPTPLTSPQVATLSIMGNPELNCDPTLYSLVFGESVLNDAVSIALYRCVVPLFVLNAHVSRTYQHLHAQHIRWLRAIDWGVQGRGDSGGVASYVYAHR